MSEKNLLSYILRALGLALIITVLLAVVHYSGLRSYLSLEQMPVLKEKLAGLPWIVNRLVFVGGGALAIVCGLGRSLVSLAGGLFYGVWEGAVFSLLAALTGSLIIFTFVRLLKRPLFSHKLGKYLGRVDQLVAENGILAVILIRLLPLTSLLLNVLIAMTRVSLSEFIIGSLIGFLPETIVFTLYGSSTQGGFFSKVTIASGLLVVVVVGCKIFSQKINPKES
jgi:uncharacterized membrane protein YdjX (TVP38/TMEM64 family)